MPRPRPHSPQVLRPGRGLRCHCRGGSSHTRPGPGRPFTASRALERPQGAAQQFRAEGERRRSLRNHRTSWSSGASAARPQPKARECDWEVRVLTLLPEVIRRDRVRHSQRTWGAARGAGAQRFPALAGQRGRPGSPTAIVESPATLGPSLAAGPGGWMARHAPHPQPHREGCAVLTDGNRGPRGRDTR